MSCRCPTLPFLPGFSINTTLGKTNFGRRPIFEHQGDIRIISDKIQDTLPGKIHERYPSIYSRGEVSDLPGWIAFDKQILTFEAFFKETLQEVYNSPFQIRKCKIFFYLEDGTVKIVEPKVENSGIPQGTVLARQRIRFPSPKDDLFYDIIDFNVGKELEFYGRNFKITSCDKFTRNFLNRLGIAVPDPIDVPEDPYIVNRQKTAEAIFAKKPNKSVDTFGKFLANDRKVLRFYGFWDDRKTENGYIHDLTIFYFLADDTFEIMEVLKELSGNSTHSIFIKRGKLPKVFNELPNPGYFDTVTILNVLGPNLSEGRYVVDPLNCGKNVVAYYEYPDLSIGAAINVYGRKVVLTDCDPYTKEFYRGRYGLDNFTPVERPKEEAVIESVPLHKRKLPPWNGYGSFEDSAQNCVTVEPKQIMRDVKKFLALDKDGMDSRVLRFKATMRSKIPSGCDRKFIICFYLCDDSISVHEVIGKSSGSTFMTRGRIVLPGQEVFTSEPPDFFEAHHFYIGATLNFCNFIFIIIDADEYALRYMELHPDQFIKSNIKVIIKKVREKLLPVYKDFVAEMLPPKTGPPMIPFDSLRKKFCVLMGEDWTEQEMITLGRAFSGVCRTERYTRSFIRQIVITELKKMLWDDAERMKEHFRDWDRKGNGFLPKKEVYTLIKACKLPLDKIVIENMLNVLEKNDECEIDGKDLFNFLDATYCPMPDIIPMNVKTDLWWPSEADPVAGRIIDWCAFNKALDLEHVFKELVKKKEEKITS